MRRRVSEETQFDTAGDAGHSNVLSFPYNILIVRVAEEYTEKSKSSDLLRPVLATRQPSRQRLPVRLAKQPVYLVLWGRFRSVWYMVRNDRRLRRLDLLSR